jgi:hypothetical protein
MIDLITTSADPVMTTPDSPCRCPVFISSGVYDGKFGNSAAVAIADAICQIWLISLELVPLMYSRLGSPHPCLLRLGETCPDDNVDGVVIKFDFDPPVDYVKSIGLLDVDYSTVITIKYLDENSETKKTKDLGARSR